MASPPRAWYAAIFLLSGIAGLVYEVVWLRMLIRSFGVTVYAVSTVLVVFMTGLAVGAMVGGSWARRARDPLRSYAIVELGIAASAGASTALMLALPSIYASLSAGSGGASLPLARFALAFVGLVVPTFLMGTTLPLMSAHLARRDESASVAGLLYGANTLGAVLGVLASGFFGLMLLGEVRTVAVAMALNAVAGVLAFLVSRRSGVARAAEPASSPAAEPPPGPDRRRILYLYAASGFCALTYQVAWSRMLNLLLGNSVYGFSLMLGAYLAGIALGSLLMSSRVARLARPLFAFGVLECVLAVLALASLMLFIALGEREIDVRHTYSQIFSMADFARMALHSVIIVVPVTFVLGALFPLASRLATADGWNTEQAVGGLYAYNTIGSILGSFLTGFVLLSALGTLGTFLLAAALSFLIGAYAITLSGAREGVASHRTAVLGLGAVFALAFSLSLRDPFYTVLRARIPPENPTLEHLEDKAAIVTMLGDTRGGRGLFINGVHVSDTSEYLPEVMVDLPLAFHPAPKRALLVGLGVGESFRGAVDRGYDVTVIELVPSVLELFKKYSDGAQRYLDDPHARVVLDDGRNYLLRTQERFDYVFVDGTPPVYSSGTVNLYSKEFVELVKSRLTDDGIFGLWFPTVCFESDFWMVTRNFTDAFPEVSMWAEDWVFGVLLMGSSRDGAFSADAEILAGRLRERAPSYHWLEAGRIKSGQLLSEDFIRARAAKELPVTDDRPRTEFPLLEFWRGTPYYHSREFYRLLAATAESARRSSPAP